MSDGQILTAAWVVTSATERPIRDGAVRVCGSRVTEIATATSLTTAFPRDEVIDFGDAVIAPGFVNAHTHTYGVLTHGMALPAASSGDFGDFLASVWWPLVENKLTAEMLAPAMRLGAAQALLSGVTTLYDIVEAPFAVPGVLRAVSEAALATGIRLALSFEASERVNSHNGLVGLGENTDFIEGLVSAPNERLTGIMCWHTSYSSSGEFIREAAAAANELGVLAHFHCNEGSYEPQRSMADHGTTTLMYYDALGVTDARLIASQCVVMSGEELDVIEAKSVAVTHLPLSNGLFGAGIAPLPDMVARGITIGLGSDGATDDFFEVVRAASVIHRAYAMDSNLIPASTAFDLATRGGAKALGLDDVGTLAVGNLADIQVIALDMPTPITADNLLDQIVFWRSAADVTDVMVHGDWCVRSGKLTRVDIDKARRETRRAAEALWARSET